MRMLFDHRYLVYPHHDGHLMLLMLLGLVAFTVVAVAIASRNGRPAFEWALTVAAAGFLGLFLLGGPGLLLGVALVFAVLVLMPGQGPSKACPQCGAKSHPDAAFCGRCKRQFAAGGRGAFCYNCGRPNITGKPFCADCGAPQDAVTTVPPAQPDQLPVETDVAAKPPKAGRWWRLGR